MLRWTSLALILAACGSREPTTDDIIGPFTGPRHRFVVDQITLPNTHEETRSVGVSLSDDGRVRNLVGIMVANLRSFGEEGPDVNLLVAGAIGSVVEIQADDLANDDAAGLWFYGHDGADARVVGGAFVEGDFVPNLLRDTEGPHTGTAVIDLPIFRDTDPTRIEASTLQVELIADPQGGYTATLAGGVRRDALLAAARTSIRSMFAHRPELHRPFWRLLDPDYDGQVTDAEFDDNIIGSTLYPDVELPVDDEVEELISFGVTMHLTPCAEGRCATAPAPSCDDRIHNGDETDVDCGGACGGCAGGETCAVHADCQSEQCNGTCAPVSCTDGVKNGFEADVDCGGACGVKCALGDVCGYHADCASGRCSDTTTTGVCVEMM